VCTSGGVRAQKKLKTTESALLAGGGGKSEKGCGGKRFKHTGEEGKVVKVIVENWWMGSASAAPSYNCSAMNGTEGVVQ